MTMDATYTKLYTHTPSHQQLNVCINFLQFLVYSIAIHPDQVRVASGQVAGHDNKEGKVCILVFQIISRFTEFNTLGSVLKLYICMQNPSENIL